MISGERAEENNKASSPSVTSLLDPPFDRESDGGDDELLSHYSSCGESEFERYCSASSAMGTPTFRSTTTSSFQDSELGSLKSFKLGGENANFKNFGAKKVLSGSSGVVTGSCSDEKDCRVLNLNRRMEEGFDLGDYWGTECVNENGSVGFSEGNGCCGAVVKRGGEGAVLGSDGGEDGKLLDDGEEALSRYEHSEGEDSMYGCGSDDERRAGEYYGRNAGFRGEEREKDENRLVMNSAVAFGDDDWDDFIQESGGNTLDSLHLGEKQHFAAANSNTYPGLNLVVQRDEVRNNIEFHSQVQVGGKLPEINVNNFSSSLTNQVKLDARVEGVKSGLIASNEVSDIDELENLGCGLGYNIFEMRKDTSPKEATANEEVQIFEAKSEKKHQDLSTGKVMSSSHNIISNNMDLEKPSVESDPLSKSVVDHNHLFPVKDKEDREVKVFKDNSSFPMSPSPDTNTRTSAQSYDFSFDQIENHFVPVKTRNFELNDVYDDEIVNDMEDILLDSGESPGSGLTHVTRIHNSHLRRPSRDGGSSASTSGVDYAHNLIKQPLRVDRVEVVGARQMMGDVSLSERLVGVKKYTAYKIRVWSGENHWEVERRYRDFSTLYHQLKKLFADHGWTLPSPWSFVEKESRKLFANASPDVIADRSVLIQECLQSLIHPKFSSNSLSALVSFLSPPEGFPDSPASDTSRTQSSFHNRGGQMEDFPTMGKTISLVVQIRPYKPTKQMLDEQHYRCAGCHRNFDDGITRVQEFVQALGWGKPRLCEYSSQLFCSSCHNNETAILPARVLHHWDFTRYPVSNLAKSYLDSIYDKPMLCVSAVNPFLLSKVPALQHVANIRNRIKTMLPYVRCPFRGSIYKGLGSRGYLLDSNDFFALRDLIDLSKGVFSALPVMVEAVSRKILFHITEQCLVCYDAGIPCGARKACDDPLSLIFPFQDGEVEKCRFCKMVFHKNCFKKIATCSCGAHFKQKKTGDEKIVSLDSRMNLLTRVAEPPPVDSDLNLLARVAEPSTGSGLLAGLFSMVIPQRSQIRRRPEPKDVDTVISMGSLPNTSL